MSAPVTFRRPRLRTGRTYHAQRSWGQVRHLLAYKTLYTVDVADSKPVEFRGSSLEDLRAFALTARRQAGHQLDQVQYGREPDD